MLEQKGDDNVYHMLNKGKRLRMISSKRQQKQNVDELLYYLCWDTKPVVFLMHKSHSIMQMNVFAIMFSRRA